MAARVDVSRVEGAGRSRAATTQVMAGQMHAQSRRRHDTADVQTEVQTEAQTEVQVQGPARVTALRVDGEKSMAMGHDDD